MIQSLELLASIIPSQLSTDTLDQDPLISRSLETWQYIGIFALAILSIGVVRLISPRIEHTILFATFVSAVLIVFFWTI